MMSMRGTRVVRRSLLQNESRRERRQLRPQRGDFGSLAREFGGFVAEVSEEGRTMSVESRRVGPARFERRPTIRGLDNILVGRRGEAPLVPPYDF